MMTEVTQLLSPELQELQDELFGENNRDDHPMNKPRFRFYEQALKDAGYVGVIYYKNQDTYCCYFSRPLTGAENNSGIMRSIIENLRQAKRDDSEFKHIETVIF